MKRKIFRVEKKTGMTVKEICDAIDLCGEIQHEALEVYKLAVKKHNYYQHLLLLKKLNNELENL